MDPKFFRKYSDIIAEAEIPVATANPDQVLRDKTIFAINWIKQLMVNLPQRPHYLEEIDNLAQELNKYIKLGQVDKRLVTAIYGLQDAITVVSRGGKDFTTSLSPTMIARLNTGITNVETALKPNIVKF
jgi:hypothetical protein